MSGVRVPGLNHVVLAGRLGRDAVLRRTASGESCCSFSMCNSRRWRDGDAWREKATWIDVTLWRDHAERIAPRLKKGVAVVVTGRLEENAWTGRDGEQRRRIVLVASAVDLLERDSDGVAPSDSPPVAGVEDDDIPF
jgi:single-strand DNA-binding protein